MGNTLSIRLPQELLDRLREKARRTGVPMGQMVRQSIEASLDAEPTQAWRKYVGIFKDGPPDLSSRKGYSRK